MWFLRSVLLMLICSAAGGRDFALVASCVASPSSHSDQDELPVQDPALPDRVEVSEIELPTLDGIDKSLCEYGYCRCANHLFMSAFFENSVPRFLTSREQLNTFHRIQI